MVRRYQDLACWQLANDLKREVYKLLTESASARRDLDFASQLRDAAGSGPANISEAFACYRHKESARYARIAKSSLTETHNHLADGVDRGHWTAERSTDVRHLAERAIGATTKWLAYLSSSDDPPPVGRTPIEAPST
jgi:four helix bundle protein